MTRVPCDEIEFADDSTHLWNGEPFTGVACEYTDEGVLVAEVEFRDGVQCGRATEYYESGKIERVSEYEYATLNGLVRIWDEDGVLLSEEVYERGIRVGKKTFDGDGSPTTVFELGEDDPQYRLLVQFRKAQFVKRPRP